MPEALINRRAPGTLKRAESELVQACGGLRVAATNARVSPSRMHSYTDPAAPDAHMPADVIVALEHQCGRPIVSGWIAQAGGFTLVSRERGGEAALSDLVTASIDATSALTKTSLASLAAGTVTASRAGEIRHQAKIAIDALSAIHDAAARIQRDGEGG